ncbi:MAG: 3-dehydroquinate synthase [Chlamydiae bacterium]|nr:3-dehydroquinate synthase [Chlamydiota bacterium]
MMHTKVVFGRGVVRKNRVQAKRVAIVTDTTVEKLVGKGIERELKEEGVEVALLSFPPGEREKSRARKEALEDALMERGWGRDVLVLGIGGGVVTDLAGFLAATYCRGVPLALIPTTLLGMVDAAIGGKVGVNTPFGKNLIGAYYPPTSIFVDPDLLSTLPEEEIRNGKTEMWKYGLIASKALLDRLEKGALYEEIATCIAIKQEIVKKDARDSGLRRILNFGHTLGHAIETVSDYQISHGEAIAMGMIGEAYLSYELGYLARSEVDWIHELFRKEGFSLKLPPFDPSAFFATLHRDKKGEGKKARFVLLEELGHVAPFDGEYCRFIEQPLLQKTLDWMYDQLETLS